jgi:hypothetical protein
VRWCDFFYWLVAVVLSSLCSRTLLERLQLLPGMGWGLPDSPGHYLDLISAIADVVLLLVAGVLWLLSSK